MDIGLRRPPRFSSTLRGHPHPKKKTLPDVPDTPPRTTPPHAWQFIRAGGVDQVVLRSGEDIRRIGQLDQKLWVALACPTRGVEFDTRTLDLIDADGDGRIRPPELIAACEWACAQLRDPDVLLQGGDTLALSAIADDTGLATEAKRLLSIIGKEGADTIALADVLDRSERLAAMRFNGDGVVTVDTAHDAPTQRTLARILETHGGTKDRSGAEGIGRMQAEAFFAEVDALRAWHAAAARDMPELPLGERTLAAAEALEAVRAKVDDFFARCRVAAFDAQALPALNPSPDDYKHVAAENLAAPDSRLAALPLAPVTPEGRLALREGVNPAWAAALRRLRDDAVHPLLAAGDALDEDQWRTLQERLAPCRRWLAARPANALGTPDARELEALAATQAGVMALIDEDARAETHDARLAELERLLRLQRDLLQLLENFVSFRAFYHREGAIFQAGTLYLDGRSCELTVQVQDVARHAALAGLAKTYLAYCDCTREGRRMTIVAAFTAGDVDFLFVGRNGVFYDRAGRDWDATITRLIENPTSVAQAFLAPYKKFVRAIEEQVARRAADSDARAQGALGSLANSLARADKTDAAAAAAPPLKAPRRMDVGTVAAIGVALGSISAVLVAIFGKFIDLGPWIPIAIAGLVLAISGPSMLIAWLKLRQRSLGPILDASGWAINGRMKVNVRLGASLSQVARMPRHARRLMVRDPYADRRGLAGAMTVLALVAAAALLAWRMDWLDARLPEPLQHAPAAPAS